MDIVAELGIIFGICLVGVGIAEFLPVPIPFSVISLVLLTLLLYGKVVQPEKIEHAGGFFIKNMGILFVPAVAGTLEYVETLRNYLAEFLVITLITTPIVYAITAWSVQLCLKRWKKKGAR